MCMVYDDNGNILVQDRNKSDWAGITFPGGHVEPGESFVESVIREVFEETGLNIVNPALCGIKQFQHKGEVRYMVLLFKTNKFSGQLKDSEEGEVFWIKRSDLKNYELANDFEEMIKVFENERISEFYYYKTKDNQWDIKLL